jgi:hypothetical protein
MRLLCCHDRQLSSDVHLVCRQALHLELRLVHLRLRILRRRLLDVVHQIHLDDLHLDVVHQIHLDDLHLDDLVRLVVDRRNHLDDRRLDDLHLDDLVRLGEHLLVEVPQSRHRLDAVLRFRMKMDYCRHAVDAAPK